MRIVAGSHKGRRLAAPEGLDTRPTSDRARQALFNILGHMGEVEGAVVVDAFAGSGAVGLEALSRGAARVSFIENGRAALAALDANIKALGENQRTLVVRNDATRLPVAREPATLAFLDPPYRSGLAAPCLEALVRQNWLAPGALAVVEIAAKEDFMPPAGFAIEDERIYGAAKLVFCRLN